MQDKDRKLNNKDTPKNVKDTNRPPKRHLPKVGLVSLGCPKALVDSEHIATQLRQNGYAFASNYRDADVVLINTCGYINSARKESLEAISEALKQNGKVVVTGCLGSVENLIKEAYPEIAGITGPNEHKKVIQTIREIVMPGNDLGAYQETLSPKVRLSPKHYAYLKIAEGCNNKCSFCIIPQLRGPLISRSLHDVMKEAEQLVKTGVKELIVIAQDTSAYGIDLKYAPSQWNGQQIPARFADLVHALGSLGIWIRLLYVYPYPHIDTVFPLMAKGKVLPYIDVPFQHASPKILKKMRRPEAQDKSLKRIQKWREACPDLAIRSTFIVGFPGETEHDFELLLEWLQEARLSKVGCFMYEPINGARSTRLEGEPSEKTKKERWEELMETQMNISRELLKEKTGQIIDVIIDKTDPDGAIGRSKWDAPEIDGNVFLKGQQNLHPGDIVSAKVIDSGEYDLWADCQTPHFKSTISEKL